MLRRFGKKRKRKVRLAPDEVFHDGAFRMERYGRFVRMRNEMPRSQHKVFMARMAEEFPEYCKEIDGLVLEIRRQVRMFNPLTLLQCAYFNLVQLTLGKKSESEYGFEEMIGLRMLDYVQSVIVATPGPYCQNHSLGQEAWEQLYEAVKTLYEKLVPWFQIARSAFLEANDPAYDIDFDKLYVEAEMLWLTVRGDRYAVHEIPHLRDFLLPHDGVFRGLFGISSDEFVEGVNKMQNALTFGLGQAVKKLHEFQDEVIGKVEASSEGDFKKQIERLIKEASRDQNSRDRFEAIAGQFFGLDLFNVEKVSGLPVSLLEQLAWPIGGNTEFFAPGEYAGWPLRVLPVNVRPFLQVEDKFYCFDLTNLMDHVYRMVERLIIGLKPDYGETWNRRQRRASEDIPFELFERLLPDSKILKNARYRGRTGKSGKLDWCEIDGLVVYDDCLLLAEIKAGAFTHKAPTGDFDAYIKSVKGLIRKPARQVTRFVECLNLEGTVIIHDKHHREITKIKKEDFREIIPCCITLDNLTELAARADKLGGIGVLIPEGVWCCSVNDLRVYADVFDSPVIFTHFLEQRRKATRERTVELCDELDHLGMYFKHNLYVDYVKNLVKESGVDHVNLIGYRAKIDEYYHMLMAAPEDAEKPGQDVVKGYFAKTIQLIGASDHSGRCKAASYLLDMSGQWRDGFNSMIGEAIVKQRETGRIFPVSFLGERGVTAFCHLASEHVPTKSWRQEHALKRMLINEQKEWLSLTLVFDGSGALVKADFEQLYEEDISRDLKARLVRAADEMRRREVRKVLMKKGRIGRNEPCPCGSGKKYKKCCGAGE